MLCGNVECGYLSYLVVTFGYQCYQVLHDSMLYTWSMVTSVTWWLPVVPMCYQHYQVLHDSILCIYVVYCYFSYFVGTCGYWHYLVLQDPRLYTWSTGQHCYHSYLCLASAITIIVSVDPDTQHSSATFVTFVTSNIHGHVT